MAEIIAIVRSNSGAPDVVRGIARAPHPHDTRQDVGVIEERFIEDLKVLNAILDDEDTPIEVIAWIAEWHLGWSRFWALRHPNAECKKYFVMQFAHDVEVRQPKIKELTKGSLDG
jgi:hypothetical protein